MLTNPHPLKDKTFLSGLLVVFVSLFFFCLPGFSNVEENETSGFFLINFFFTLGYLFYAGFSNWKDMGHRTFFLVLFLISAYSLNREMTVFQQTVPWFGTLLVIACLNLVLFAFIDQLPVWAKHVLCITLGLSFVSFLYLAVYLVPLYAVSLAIFWIFGISLHTFVPLLLCLQSIAIMRHATGSTRRLWWSFSAGITMAVGYTITYSVCWSNYSNEINRHYQYSSLTDNYGLPSWVTVAQHTPPNSITEKILKTGLVYDGANTENFNFFWRTPRRNFGEEILHDPLIMTATFFSAPLNILEEHRVNILKSMFDARHHSQERLWSGEDLVTEQVESKIQLWPAFRLSYTEMEIIVTNQRRQQWSNQQEGIYTFYLPEGGVVTSLSLWIDGREAKGILTTKEKADSAYKTIVGVEVRDPSVVHWQEGNTVSVRVFPIAKGQSRKFKIGVTAPLTLCNKQLLYDNIHFDGPSPRSATQHITINTGKDKVEKNGRYESDWNFTIPQEPLSSQSFSFDNQTYSVQPYNPTRESFTAKNIYLDINASWTSEEFDSICKLAKGKNVFVAGDRILTDENKVELFEELSNYEFSLFPFYEIRDDSSSLVISKSSLVSPTIDEIRTSEFMVRLQEYFREGHQVKLFNLDTALSPYLKSLKEARTIRYEQGNIAGLEKILTGNCFTAAVENDNQVLLDNAQGMICRTNGTQSSQAPDHLMRMFAYNHILKKSGNGLISGAFYHPDLVEEATKAYVVTPVSSLVVLETAKDYERFDITSSNNSLQNASAKSKGAVPEPHEWAIIIVVILMVAYFKFRLA